VRHHLENSGGPPTAELPDEVVDTRGLRVQGRWFRVGYASIFLTHASVDRDERDAVRFERPILGNRQAVPREDRLKSRMKLGRFA